MNPYSCLETAMGLLTLWIFWYLFWKDYVVDKFRQDVFSLRNDIFWDTASGKAPFTFDSPEYQKAIEVLNVTIRHIENLTILRFVLMYAIKGILAPGRSFETLDQENQLVTSTTSPEAKEYLKNIQCVHGKYTIRYLLTVSPTFIAFMCTAILWVAIGAVPRALGWSFSAGTRAFRDIFRKFWWRFCTEIGELNEISASRAGKSDLLMPSFRGVLIPSRR